MKKTKRRLNMHELMIQIASDEADASELDAATRRLRAELQAVEGCDISQASTVVPMGAKAGDAISLGQLVLSLVGSGGIAVTLISVLRDWLTRHKDFKLKIKRGATEIELSGGNPAELKGLLAEVKTLLVDLSDA
jgi:hypothetical protein